MLASLFLAAVDRDFLVFAIFILLPLFGRLIRSLGEKAESASKKRARPRPRPEIDPAAEARAEVDVEEVLEKKISRFSLLKFF